MKIYIHRAEDWYKLYINDSDINLLSKYATVVTEGDRMEPMSEDELISRLKDVDVVLSLNGKGVADFTPRVIKEMSKSVKLVCIAHWWNIHNTFVPMCRENGIQVVEGSNMVTVAVAEWTLASIMYGRRKIDVFDKRMKSGEIWGEPRRCAGMVRGSTIGLVGLGRIGRFTAHYLQQLGANIIAYDAMPAEEITKLDIEPVSLMEIFKRSDVISLHLPVNQYTTGMIKKEHFEAIKDGAVLVNSARAALYNENDLIDELSKNRFTAFLDVFAEPEPLAVDSPLRKMDNVVMNPHIAGDNLVMFKETGTDTVNNLIEYIRTGTFTNRQYDLHS